MKTSKAKFHPRDSYVKISTQSSPAMFLDTVSKQYQNSLMSKLDRLRAMREAKVACVAIDTSKEGLNERTEARSVERGPAVSDCQKHPPAAAGLRTPVQAFGDKTIHNGRPRLGTAHLSYENTKPWLKGGMSRATWYRRRREATLSTGLAHGSSR